MATFLKTGRSIAQKGFASTFNWLVTWVSGFCVGKGMTFVSDFTGTKIGVDILPGEGILVSCGGDKQPYVISLDPAVWGSGNNGGTGGEANIKIVGTDGSEAYWGDPETAQEIHFASASDSNVEIIASGGGTSPITLTVGVYYT